MPNYVFKLSTSEVDATTRPVLKDPPGSAARMLTGVSRTHFDLVRAALLEREIRFSGTSAEINTKLAAEATRLVRLLVPRTNVEGFFTSSSRPVGDEWLPTAERYLHPTTTGVDVCISYVTSEVDHWYQLYIRADQIITPADAKPVLSNTKTAARKRKS